MKKKYNYNILKSNALILGHFMEGLKSKIQAREGWKSHIQNKPIGILKAINKLYIIIKTVDNYLHQSLKRLKMWSISNKMRRNLWLNSLNVSIMRKILCRFNMESLHYQSTSKPYHNMMHQN